MQIILRTVKITHTYQSRIVLEVVRFPMLMRRLSPIKNRIGLNESAKNYGLIRDFLNKIRALIKHISPETLKRGLKLSHT